MIRMRVAATKLRLEQAVLKDIRQSTPETRSERQTARDEYLQALVEDQAFRDAMGEVHEQAQQAEEQQQPWHERQAWFPVIGLAILLVIVAVLSAVLCTWASPPGTCW